MDNKRPCTPLESLAQSLKEMKLMRESKLPKKSWWELKAELDPSNSLEQERYGEDLEDEDKNY